ncbi:hypothetical protein OXX79_000744 [Metschnikowia pulcherrima]
MKPESFDCFRNDSERITSKRKGSDELTDARPRIPQGLIPVSRLSYASFELPFDESDTITLGSSKSSAGLKNYIYLDGELISEVHATIIFKNGEFYVVDTQSTYGVLVNDCLLFSKSDEWIEDGSRIRLGLHMPPEEIQWLRSLSDSGMCQEVQIENAAASYNFLVGVDSTDKEHPRISLKLLELNKEMYPTIKLNTESSLKIKWCSSI